METNYLAHYGILGMRWGVRRYQNPDGSLTDAGRKRYISSYANNESIPAAKHKANIGRKVESKDFYLKKGTKVQRVTSLLEKDDNGSTYVSYKNRDNKAYVSIAKDWMASNYKIQMKTLSDIKIAGKKAQAKAFINMLSDTTIDELVNHTSPIVRNSKGKQTIDSKKARKKFEKIYKDAWKNQDSFDSALLEFNSGLTNRRVNSNNLDFRFYKELKKQGYNALVDLNDLNFAEAPIIFINRNKSLKTTKISQISDKDVEKAQMWLDKHDLVKEF